MESSDEDEYESGESEEGEHEQNEWDLVISRGKESGDVTSIKTSN